MPNHQRTALSLLFLPIFSKTPQFFGGHPSLFLTPFPLSQPKPTLISTAILPHALDLILVSGGRPSWGIQSHQVSLATKKGVKVTQLCPTLCDPMDYTVHGILQARILEWVDILFAKESSQPRDRT